MALSKIQPASIDLTANYAFTGTNSIAGIDYEEKKLATVTASSSATLSFTSGIDGTYNIYKFRFIDMHPASDDAVFQFQGSSNGGTSYGLTITSSAIRAYHNEADNSAGLNYEGSNDLAQSTNFQYLMEGVGNDNDQAGSGELFLFNPSSTTFVKHFIARTQFYQKSDGTQENDYGGYFNTTSAINAVQFKMSNGNTDSGTIEMYGIN